MLKHCTSSVMVLSALPASPGLGVALVARLHHVASIMLVATGLWSPFEIKAAQPIASY